MHKNNENLGKVWGELFLKRDKKKFAKFSSQISSDYAAFFNPFMQGGNAERDTITGEEFLLSEKIIRKESLKLKSLTNKQIEIGKELKDTQLIVVKEGNPLPYWNDKTHIAPADLGFTYYFLKDSDVKEMKKELRASADEVSVITLNGEMGNCDFLRTMDGINNIYGLEFYGGNESDRENCPTFEEMCDNENLKKMGVLRMDVDNLGNIFQRGIPAERATLSRYAALSRSFDFFFSGYLNTIWREEDPNRSFIIYSGGDDVFIVGSWDVTISLAKKIRDDFKDFTCANPAFSLSGGIAIMSPSYPIMKGADESATEESAAKNHLCQDQTKNSISFMDMPLNWDLEFPPVVALQEQLVNFLNENKLPKSFVSKLMSHYVNAKIQNHTITVPKTYWMLTYDLSRMKERLSVDVKQLIDNCIKEVCDKNRGLLNGQVIHSDYHALELWAFAARWAELVYRKDKE
jgi:CRISPR-associated protein Csm1